MPTAPPTPIFRTAGREQPTIGPAPLHADYFVGPRDGVLKCCGVTGRFAASCGSCGLGSALFGSRLCITLPTLSIVPCLLFNAQNSAYIGYDNPANCKVVFTLCISPHCHYSTYFSGGLPTLGPPCAPKRVARWLHRSLRGEGNFTGVAVAWDEDTRRWLRRRFSKTQK